MNYKGNDKYGALPRRTVIANQPHMLAYINPQEEMLLRQLGGTGQPGPMGVPAYPPGDGGFSPDGGGGYGGGGGFGGFGGSEGGGGGGYDSGYVDPGLAVAAAQAAAQQQAAANAAAMAAADAAIAEQMAAAAQEEANAAAMAEAEAAITFDIPTVSTGSITTEEAKNNIGSSGYVSVDAIAGTGIDPETNYGDANPNSPNAYFDAFGNAYNTAIEAEVADNVAAGYNDVPYMGDNTFEDYEAEYSTSPDPIEIDEPDPIINTGFPENPEEGPPDNFEPPVNEPEPTVESEYFNLFRSTAPSSWLRDSIWSSVGTGPDFDVDVYQEADGALRFRETGELVPEEYMKYIDLARRTEMKAPGEEDDTVVDTVVEPLDDDTVVDTVVEPLDDDTVVEPLDDDTVVEPLDDDTIVETEVDPIDMSNYAKYSNNILQMQTGLMDMDLRYDVNGDGVVNTQDATRIQQMFEEGTPFILPSIPSSTAITNQKADGSNFTDMTTIVEGPTDYSMDPDVAESTASTLSGRAQGFYDLISGGEKGLYEVYEQSLNNRRNRNPMARQAAQDAVDEYLYNNLTPDELRAWQDGQFNPITDPTSSVYNPQGIPEGLL